MKKIHCLMFISIVLLIFSVPLFIFGAVSDQSGFYQLNPVRYYFHNGSYYSRIYHTTSEVQMWYTFLKADTDTDNKPLFLFFNGGPGSGTTCGLLGFYTARKTLDNQIYGGGDTYIDIHPCAELILISMGDYSNSILYHFPYLIQILFKFKEG